MGGGTPIICVTWESDTWPLRRVLARLLSVTLGAPGTWTGTPRGNTQKVARRAYRKRRVANQANADALEGTFDEDAGA